MSDCPSLTLTLPDSPLLQFYAATQIPGLALPIIAFEAISGSSFVSMGAGGDVPITALGSAVLPVNSGWVSLPVGARVEGLMEIYGAATSTGGSPTFISVAVKLR